MRYMDAINPCAMMINLWTHRSLIVQLTKSEVLKRYKGSYLGMLWSLLNPLLMLGIYTFVFSNVLHARWGDRVANTGEFAILLYCGLNVFTILSESITRSPALIAANANYVKKVIFPLEILPLTVVGSSIINGTLGFVVLLVGILLIHGSIPLTFLLLPVILIPFLLIVLGMCWVLSSLGVYVKDIENVVGFFTTGLLFLSPIFYSITSIPSQIRLLFNLNPLTYVVEDVRKVLIWGQFPDWHVLLWLYAVSIIIAVLGYAWFQKTREGFADII